MRQAKIQGGWRLVLYSLWLGLCRKCGEPVTLRATLANAIAIGPTNWF
jgi:hypothetical protein